MGLLVLIYFIPIFLNSRSLAEDSCGNMTHFSCTMSDCIGFDSVCDGDNDCIYGNDEMYCGGCPQKWYYWRGNLYYVENDIPLNYADATDYCMQLGATISSILNEDELGYILYLSPKDESTWIGLDDLVEPDNFVWQDGSPLNFTNWKINQPNNVAPKEECGEKYADGTWNDNQCYNLMKFICKKPATESDGIDGYDVLLKGDTDRVQDEIQVGCALPLGMQSQIITDDQISSSSSLDTTTLPQYARLLNGSYWMPHPGDDAPWLQISFHEQMIFSGLVVEGIKTLDVGWLLIDEFYLMYSDNLINWMPYKFFEHNGKCGDLACEDKLFDGHEGMEGTVYRNEHPCRTLLVFRHQFKARHFRLYPVVALKSYLERLQIGCRIELLGCTDNDCDYSLGVASGGISSTLEMSSSSSIDALYTANSARLRLITDIGSPGTGWIPDPTDQDPWLEANLADTYVIRSVVVQGCVNRMSWVEELCISYSDEKGMDTWLGGHCKIFKGNSDSEGLVRIDLSPAIETNAIRIHPKKYFVEPCLRIELIGCAAGIKRCEIDHLASCAFPRVCTDQTALIASLGHPGKYPPRSSCTWNIITGQGSFIHLTFVHFDIPSLGECDSSSVMVYNGDADNEQFEIDRFCNSRPPPDTVLSDFNHLFMLLQTGAEEPGSGFIAKYSQHSRVNITKGSDDTTCQEDWTYYRGNCYMVVDNVDSLSWFDAEESCMQQESHLVSIRDEQDMDFIHSLIIDSLQDHVSPPLNVFIGLKLDNEEWIHRWLDGRPMSYTDWHSPLQGESWTERQPDGGRLELCVQIVMRNFHSTDHWHDIPCVSRNEAAQFICMKPSKDANATSTVNRLGNLTREGSCPANLVTCTNGACVHKILACTKGSKCLPEHDCQVSNPMTYVSQILQGDCREWEYQCARSRECISASFLCDFKQHCLDGSDEEGCDYPDCTADEYRCSDGQCISESSRCDLVIDCLSGSDEEMCAHSSAGFQCYDGRWLPAHAQCDGQRDCAGKNWEDETTDCGIYESNFTCGMSHMKCKNGACVEETQRCLYGKDKYGFPTGCRDATHLQQCDSPCPMGSLKCPGSYCIPTESRCDDVIDCPNGEDEAGCDDFVCHGYYRCHGHKKCLEMSQLCDDVTQCPDGDDELFCDVPCFPGCNCTGLSFACVGTTWTKDMASLLPGSMRQITLVGVSETDLATAMGKQTIQSHLFLEMSSMKFLLTLNISENVISHLEKVTFYGAANLRILSLAYNLITSFPNATFMHLSRLQYLDMSGNPLKYVDTGAFRNLGSLHYLNVEDTKFQVGEDTGEDTFAPLVTLAILHSDKYLYCCLTSGLNSITECLPEPDQFSSCEDLMRNAILRVFMWILGLSALLGNAYVFYERVRPSSGNSRAREIARVQNFMVGNLAVADGIMGIYMVIIASADEFYRDRYAYFAEEWQKSVVCKIAGILSVLSSEASVLFITAISVDRFMAVMFPHSKFKIKIKSANYIAGFIWLVAFIISVVPLMIPGVQDSFYGRSSVCLALPLTSSRPLGWQYSVAVFLGFNFVAFATILVCYVFIFFTMKFVAMRAGSAGKNRSQEYQLAIRMSLLVFSDMCCWMPIVLLGIISLTGAAEIPGTSYAWIAVFVLPLNSSLNPYLYTIFTSQSAVKAKISNSLFSKSQDSADISLSNTNKGYEKDSSCDKGSSKDDLEEDVCVFVQDLFQNNIMSFYPNCTALDGCTSLSDLRSQLIMTDFQTIEKDLTKALKFLTDQKLGYSGTITEDQVFVRQGSKGSQAYLILPNLKPSSQSNDADYKSKLAELQVLLGTSVNNP